MKYLLNVSVDTPLSVDKNVWPNSDEVKDYQELFEDYFPEENSAPNGLAIYQLRKSIILTQYRRQKSVLLGIVTTTEAGNILRSVHRISQPNTTAETLINYGWEFLGYDVADQWLISALSSV